MKFRNLFFVVVLALLATVNLFAAATDTTYNAGGTVYETKSDANFIEYRYTSTTVATDSVGLHFSKAFAIESYNIGDAPAYVYLVMSNDASGTEDCNVGIEYSFDRTTWVTGPLNSGVVKDQLTTTAILDTLNWAGGAPDLAWRTYPWFRLRFDFQAGNPTGTTLTCRIRIPKDSAFNRRFAEAANSL